MTKIIQDDYDENALFGIPAEMPPRRLSPSPPQKKSNNPLAAYFRVPGLTISLPTKGAFLEEGAYEPNMAGEVEVLPMRAQDELLMKSPDALMSGEALVKLLESCVPAIKTPRAISAPDLDVLLLAIRASSYGENMDLDVVCPECKEENTFACHIPAVLQTMKTIPSENPVRLGHSVIAYVRPYNLENATRLSLAVFNETRSIQALEGKGEETLMRARNESAKRLNKVALEQSADCVMKVVVKEGEVTERKHISEFLDNIPRDQSKKIDDKLKELNGMGIDKTLPVQCTHCKHEWSTDVEFDPASFFEQDS